MHIGDEGLSMSSVAVSSDAQSSKSFVFIKKLKTTSNIAFCEINPINIAKILLLLLLYDKQLELN